MDEYGFGAAAQAGLRMFEQCARQSGRTMRMIERVKDGDQIVVLLEREAKRLRSLLPEAKKPGVVVIVINEHMDVEGRVRRPAGRTFFDHEWQRMFFERAIQRAARELEAHQRGTSQTWSQAPDDAGKEADRRLEPFRTRDWEEF